MRRSLRAFLRNLTRRTAVDRSLDDEVRACVDIITANNVAAGMSPTEARRRALVEMGGVEVVKERVRDVRRGAVVDTAVRDLRHAGRMLRKQPLHTAAIVVTLAIGLGAATSAFSLVNRLVFGQPASQDPDAFFRVVRDGGESSVATAAQYETWRDQVTTAREVAAWSSQGLYAPLGRTDPTNVRGLKVSCNALQVLGAGHVAGRLLDAGDCETGARVAVISERLWRQRFDGDVSRLGDQITYASGDFTIVGVADVPPVQRQADDEDQVFDVWLPYTVAATDGDDWSHGGRSPWLEVAGLLASGETRDTATAEFRAIEAGAFPVTEILHYSGSARPDRQAPARLIDGSRWSRAPVMWFGVLAAALALPLLLLVMACVNVAALLLARSVGRQREMAVRLMLGTSRPALVRMLLTETLVVAGAAAVLSLALVLTLPPLVARFFDAEVTLGATDGLRPDWRVFAFLGGCGLVATLASGLAPALAALSPRPIGALQGRQRGRLGGRAPGARKGLIAIQVAASLVTLVTALMFSTGVSRFLSPGFATDGVVVASITSAQRSTTPLVEIAALLADAPGLEHLAVADHLPLTFYDDSERIRIAGTDEVIIAGSADVSAGYFSVLGLPLTLDRPFAPPPPGADQTETTAVVSRSFARRYFGNANPVGQVIETVRYQPRDQGGGVEVTARLTVVGVAADRLTRVSSDAAPKDGSIFYRPLAPTTTTGVVMATAPDPAGAVKLLEARLRGIVGTAVRVETADAALREETLGSRRVQAVLLTLGVVAFLLASVGVVGMVSFDAGQRRREFAIRSALGASAWALRHRVVSAGFRAVAAGLLVGMPAAWGLLSYADTERLLPLSGLASDAGPYLMTATLLAVTALATLVAVAWPAGNRDPLIALREE